MDPVTQLYIETNQPLTAVLDAVPPDRWAEPSPCEGWTARDIVHHMVDTQREFLGGHGLEVGPPPDVDANPAAAWSAHSAAVTRLLADDAVPTTRFDGHFGPTTIGETLRDFYIFDMVVHRWDVARATGGDETLSDEELDRVESSIDGFGDALYMEGICKPGVAAAEDADRQARLLARMGRRV